MHCVYITDIFLLYSLLLIMKTAIDSAMKISISDIAMYPYYLNIMNFDWKKGLTTKARQWFLEAAAVQPIAAVTKMNVPHIIIPTKSISFIFITVRKWFLLACAPKTKNNTAIAYSHICKRYKVHTTKHTPTMPTIALTQFLSHQDIIILKIIFYLLL